MCSGITQVTCTSYESYMQFVQPSVQLSNMPNAILLSPISLVITHWLQQVQGQEWEIRSRKAKADQPVSIDLVVCGYVQKSKSFAS